MGHRANYVLVEQGKPTMYYTHWGSKEIPALLLAGPERTWEYVQRATPCEELLDSVWAEGGLLIDRDHRRLLFWGGEDILCVPYLRRFLLPALRQLWPEWIVEWALHGVADLADALHIDRATVLAGGVARGFNPDRSISDEMLLENEYQTTLITVRWKDGVVFDYSLTYLPGIILSVGPRLLNVLSRRTPDPLPHERDEDYEGGAFFDLTTQNMWVWDMSTLDPRYLTALPHVWPEWHVRGHVDGMVHQVILSGRDPSDIIIPQEEAIAKLVQTLTMEGPNVPNLGTLLAAATTGKPEGTEIHIAPGFFSVPEPILSVEERQRILQRLFHTSLQMDS
jgi:hypothetical protein